MTYLLCNGVKLTPFEFNDFDAQAKADLLSDFPLPSGAMDES